MRWLVEVSSLTKAEEQKFCVEAESWQRALQAARAQRGEEGSISHFAIDLLAEGYRAVDPVGRTRFVVKRAPDTMPVTTIAIDSLTGLVNPPSSAKPTERLPSSPPSSAPAPAPRVAQETGEKESTSQSPPRPTSSLPPRPTVDARVSSKPPSDPAKARTMTFAANRDSSLADATEAASVGERPPTPAIGSSIPGLPALQLILSREQEPTEASPLTYREYVFAAPEGTTEEVAADILRAQLQLVEAHLGGTKVGKLVNLAVFDFSFTGKPPRPPVATLTWKDWKGAPELAFPRKVPGSLPPPRPPSRPPPSLLATAGMAPSIPKAPPIPRVAEAGSSATSGPASTPPKAPSVAPPAPALPVVAQPVAPPAPVVQPVAPSVPPPAPVVAQPVAPSVQPPAPVVAQPVASSVPPPAPVVAQPVAPSVPPPAPVVAQPVAPSVPPPAPLVAQPVAPSVPAPAPVVDVTAGPGSAVVARTRSGRFLPGRIRGDELIASFFEAMHDLHFLRDALDGGQFCLTLATEALPARAAFVHFFDVETREWVLACAAGDDSQRFLAQRIPDDDGPLRDAARRGTAVVHANAADEQSLRYRELGGVRSLIVAPIRQAGRVLGALELIDPLDGEPFNETEGLAIAYVAEQFAEYLGSRGIVLDRDRIRAAAGA